MEIFRGERTTRMAGKRAQIIGNEIVVPDEPAVQALLGSGPTVAHDIGVTRLLRNYGYVVPAPIMSQYEWPDNPSPFKTQKITAALLTMNPRAYVLSEMGTGKTRAALYACDHMLKTGEIKRVLVVAPLSTLSQVWDREIYQYFNWHSAGVVHGPRSKRLQVLREDHQFYIINYDGVGVMQKDLAAIKFDAVIIDEASAYRNKSTERWKKLKFFVARAKYVWGMTGSPTPNKPIDAWGIAKMITPHTATMFLKEFESKTMTQVTQFRWIAKPDANDHVFKMLQPSVRYKRDDCVELPPVSYSTVSVNQSAQIKTAYKKMVNACKVAFLEGRIVAANEGVAYMKLLQIACGWAYTDKKGVVRLDNTDRVNELRDIISNSLGKVIVFVSFKHAARGLHERLVKHKEDVALITGDTPKRFRDQIFTGFQHGDSPRVLVAHPQCMAHGLTLTTANTIVWFTPTNSLEIYEQANARILRPGQDKKSLVVHLTATPIESKIYKRLQEKSSLQGSLLEMFNDN